MVPGLVEPITETPASLLLLISLFLVLGILAGGRLTDFVLLGMVLGLLIRRPSALLMLAFLPLYLGLRSRKWLASALVVVIPTLMITAWILQVRNSTGHFVMINVSSSQNVFLGNNAYTPLYKRGGARPMRTRNLPSFRGRLRRFVASRGTNKTPYTSARCCRLLPLGPTYSPSAPPTDCGPILHSILTRVQY